VIVALVLGAGVGGLIEHQRVTDDSNANARPVAHTTTTTKKATTADWFGTRLSSACPALQDWYLAFGEAVYALLAKNEPWSSTRTALLHFVGTAETAYRSLLPLANPAGMTELRFLLTSLSGRSTAIAKSSSVADFFKTRKSASTPTVARDIRTMLESEQKCPKK
jgi:hypothetical protein